MAMLSLRARERIRLAHLGKKMPCPAWNKGKHLTEEHRLRISNSLKGRRCKPRTLSHIKNLSRALMGRKAWNKGKPWPEDVRLKISDATKGRVPWNKGKKNCYSQDTLRQMSLIKIGSNNPKFKGGIKSLFNSRLILDLKPTSF